MSHTAGPPCGARWAIVGATNLLKAVHEVTLATRRTATQATLTPPYPCHRTRQSLLSDGEYEVYRVGASRVLDQPCIELFMDDEIVHQQFIDRQPGLMLQP